MYSLHTLTLRCLTSFINKNKREFRSKLYQTTAFRNLGGVTLIFTVFTSLHSSGYTRHGSILKHASRWIQNNLYRMENYSSLTIGYLKEQISFIKYWKIKNLIRAITIDRSKIRSRLDYSVNLTQIKGKGGTVFKRSCLYLTEKKLLFARQD